jgi:hypothetical protein
MRRCAIATRRVGAGVRAMRSPVVGMLPPRKDERGMVSASFGTGGRRGARGGRGDLPVRIGDGRAGRSRRCAFPTTAFFEMPIRRPISAVEYPSDQSRRSSWIASSVHSNPAFVLRIRVSCCCCCFIGTPPRGLPGARERPDRPLRGAHAGRHRHLGRFGDACCRMCRDREATESQTLTGTISPNGIVRLLVGVSQMTGTPGSCGWSLQFRSVA